MGTVQCPYKFHPYLHTLTPLGVSVSLTHRQEPLPYREEALRHLEERHEGRP